MFISFIPIIRTCLMLYSTRQANYYINIQPNFRQLHCLTISVSLIEIKHSFMEQIYVAKFQSNIYIQPKPVQLYSPELYNYIAQAERFNSQTYIYSPSLYKYIAQNYTTIYLKHVQLNSPSLNSYIVQACKTYSPSLYNYIAQTSSVNSNH